MSPLFIHEIAPLPEGEDVLLTGVPGERSLVYHLGHEQLKRVYVRILEARCVLHQRVGIPSEDLNWMARGRIRLLRQIEHGEIDLDDPDEEHEWITHEYVAELREAYSEYLDEGRDSERS